MERSLSKWMLWHAVTMTMLTGISIIMGVVLPVIIGMVASMLVLLIWQRQAWLWIKPLGGYANQITLLRFVILIIALVLVNAMHQYLFVALVVFVMIADGIDGYLARRFNQASDFGEIFDTEVDAFLALSLALLISMNHPEAAWVLVGGLMRYAMIILYRILGWHERRRPHMPETKLFAVLYFISLLIPWLLPWDIAVWIVLGGNAMVSFSFIREFVLIMRAD
jgi:phosphatidylglycerophosphate synthase